MDQSENATECARPQSDSYKQAGLLPFVGSDATG